MLRVGIVGLGFMGWIHWLAYRRVAGARVVAICESDAKKRSGDWTGIRGNFGPPGEVVNLRGIATFEDLGRMLAECELDLVDVCLPPSLHCSAVLQALAAGKHVFCEKPMALTAPDCDRMVSTARGADRRLFVGHVLPFFPEYEFARRLAVSGEYGRLLGGSFKRVISDPSWLKDFYDPRRIGGPMIDLHVHDAHFIRLLFGMPQAVLSRGRMRGEVVSYCQSLFRFADPSLVVGCTAGVIDQQGRPFNHGFEIHFERATLQFEFAALADRSEWMPLKLLDDRGQVLRPMGAEQDAGDEIGPFAAEINEVVRCIEAGCDSQVLGGDLARDAIVISQMQSEAIGGQSQAAAPVER
jgi:predicted dehydrogenase